MRYKAVMFDLFETLITEWGHEIYTKKAMCADLGVEMSECIFVGDGGSNELIGARNAGMKAIQAKWYTNRYPDKRGSIEGFRSAEEPMDILKLM